MKRPGSYLAIAWLSLLVFCGYGAARAEQPRKDDFTIVLEAPHHIHAFWEAALAFQVRTADGVSIAGLRPTVTYQFHLTDRVDTTRAGDILDNGDGTYRWKTSFGNVGTYVLTFKFLHDGVTHSKAFPLEISMAGGERIVCPATGKPEFVYQIRWGKTPGETRGGEKATFNIELRRSINEIVNTDKPWLNRFDHLRPGDLLPSGAFPKVAIGSTRGEKLVTVEYAGMGSYKADYQFEPVPRKTTYWLRVTFEDDCGGVDESGEGDPDFQFPVLPAD